MARFSYRAVDARGREQRGAVEAVSEAQARDSLKRKRLVPVEVARDERAPAAAPQRPGRPAPRRPLLGPRLSHKQRLLVTRQLATLIDAAVPVDEALGMIAQQQERAETRRILADVQAGVVEGQRFADALARQPASFPGLYRAAAAGGEASGRLGQVLGRLADYLTRAQTLRSKVVTALIYPAALSLVAVVVITCLMIFVVPPLTEQFENFDAQLPVLTQILIGTSKFLNTFWPLVLLALAGLIFAIRASLARPGPRRAFDAGALKLPLVGKRLIEVNASRFARATAMLVSSGAPVLDAVRIAEGAVDNRLIKERIAAMATQIEEGASLSSAMRASGVMPVMITYMAASGENAGELPRMLDKAADHLDEEFETFTAAALSLLEPAIIVVMGATVASIVLAIMLPILRLNQLATG